MGTVAVYELIENRLQKIYVGCTELPLNEEVQRMRKAPPPLFKDWEWDSVLVRQVESFNDPKLAKAFFERYATKTPPPGWSVLKG